MPNKYYQSIDKIKVDENFKKEMISNLNKIKEENMQEEKNKGKIFAKATRISTIIKTIIGLALCGGVAYAGVTGIFKGQRNFGEDIQFSEKLEEYAEEIKNVYIEKDGTRIDLKASVCSEGFVILNFGVTFSEELEKFANEAGGLAYLSFNDKAIIEEGYEGTFLSGANSNIIINGEKKYIKGFARQEIEETIRFKEYNIYQLYFLSEDLLGEEDTFTLTLGNVALAIGGGKKLVEFDENFEIELSKTNVKEDTIIITNENAEVTYSRLTSNIEKVFKNPLQNIIKLSTIIEDETKDNSTYLLDEDYIGEIEYKVYDQDGNELSAYSTIAKTKVFCEDGTVLESEGLNMVFDEWSHGDKNSIERTEYIAVDGSINIKKLTIEVYETNEYYESIRNIGTYYIDLEKETIESESKNVFVKEPKEVPDPHEGSIDIADIKEFTMDIEEDYAIHIIEDYPEDSIKMYEIELLDRRSMFDVMVCYDKTLYYESDYFQEHVHSDIDYTVIDENSEYMIVVNTAAQWNHENVKDVVGSIKSK